MATEAPWHEQDEFWLAVEPILFARRRMADAPTEVERVMALAGLRAGMAVLDLGCGIGRHALEFARQGLRVSGVDRTRSYLEKAARRAEAEGLSIELVEADMRDFRRPGAFDAAVNLFSSFGYFESPDDDRRVARNILDSLRPGGALVMEMMGKEILARTFQERSWMEEDGVILLEERRLGRAWGWIENRWILLIGGRRIERRLSLRLYSAAELVALLSEAGFGTADAFGDLTGGAYDHAARRLVVVARK
jgi:SAM-dependent methyltransferase